MGHRVVVATAPPSVDPGVLVRGQTKLITGGPFGTKANNYQNPYTTSVIWDTCNGQNAISARYHQPYPNVLTGANAAFNMAYQPNGYRGVSAPSLTSVGIASGGAPTFGLGTAGGANICLATDLTRPTSPGGTAPYMMFMKWYEQADSLFATNLNHAGTSGNYKWWAIASTFESQSYPTSDLLYLAVSGFFNPPGTLTGNGPIGNDDGFPASGIPPVGPKNYIQITPQAGSGSPNCYEWGLAFNQTGSTYVARKIAGNWVEFMVWYYAAPDNTGALVQYDAPLGGLMAKSVDYRQGVLNKNFPGFHLDMIGTLDGFSTPNTRNIIFEGFNADIGGPNQVRYFSDLYLDFGIGWFFITNNATWGSETVRAIQPYTSWADTQVLILVNGDQLPGGSTAHLHYRTMPWNSGGSQYLGSYTLQ